MLLSLWRNVLLVRRLPNRLVFGLGGSLIVLAAAIGPISRLVVNSSGGAGQLGWYWFDQDLEAAPIVVWFVVVDVFLRALGMMMIGIGVTLSATGVIWLAAVGRMALTNYLTQTALGLIILRELSDRGGHSRLGLVAFTVGVWAIQLAWSHWWLRRFTLGPIEWIWRTATYLEIGPVRSAQKPRRS